MAATITKTDEAIHWASPEEGRALFDERARELMGISGDEFIRRWDAGEYADIADQEGHRYSMHLSMLMPFALQDE